MAIPFVRMIRASDAYDQGIGRALWFVSGADIDWAAGQIAANFVAPRHADLWAGLGLAIAFAGCADQASLLRARELACDFLPDLIQGAIFGAAAHQRADCAPVHTELVLQTLAGITAVAAAEHAADTLAALPITASADTPRYELWRKTLRDRFASGHPVAQEESR